MTRQGTGALPGFFQTRAGTALAKNWAAFFLFLMLICFSFTGRGFLSLVNFQNILHMNVTQMLLAAAETFVIISGGMDLSVGFVMGLASVGSAKLIQILLAAGVPPAIAVCAACALVLALSLAPGFASGLMIVKFKVPAFIATLGMWGITNGLALKICMGYPMMGLPDWLPSLGNGYLFYLHPGRTLTLFRRPSYMGEERIRELVRILPLSLVFVAAVAAVLIFLLKRRRFGLHTLAIGGNMDAALRSGIDVDRHVIKVYMLSSFLSALAGVFNVFQTGIGNYTTFGSMYELFAVAAVVIGGASLSGGKGSLPGSLIGVAVLATLENGLSLSGVQPFYRYIAVGVLLVVAVVIDRLFPDLF